MFIIAAMSELVFSVFKGIVLVTIGAIYTIMDWINPH